MSHAQEKFILFMIGLFAGMALMLAWTEGRAYAQYGGSVQGDLRIMQLNHNTCLGSYNWQLKYGTPAQNGLSDAWNFPSNSLTRDEVSDFCTKRVLEKYRKSVALSDKLLQGIIDSAGSGVQAPAPRYPGERREYRNVQSDEMIARNAERKKMIEQFSAGLP